MDDLGHDQNEVSLGKIYQPLDRSKRQIRVLVLHSGSPADVITGSLVVTSVGHQVVNHRSKFHSEELQLLMSEAQNLFAEMESAESEGNASTPDMENITAAFISLSQRVHFMLGQLQPSSSTSTVLQDNTHAEPLLYDAVSYRWGNDGSKSGMLLNGEHFDAPSSAVEVLKRFRSPTAAQKIWIDAICINQTDLDERTHQVTLMGDIYESALTTRVWLGESDEDSPIIVPLIQSLGAQIGTRLHERLATSPSDSENYGASLRASMSQVPLPSGFIDAVPALDRFYGRSWFSRAWVYQEVMLAQDCTCAVGDHILPWTAVLWTITYIFEKMNEMIAAGPALHYTLDFYGSLITFQKMAFARDYRPGQSAIPLNLSALIDRTSILKVTDARDKIFATLSMTRWARAGLQIPELILPNYRKSLGDVYRDATRLTIMEDGDLDLAIRHADEHPLAQRIVHYPELRGWLSWVIRPPVTDLLSHPGEHDLGGCMQFTEKCSADSGRRMGLHRLSRADDGFEDSLFVQGYRLPGTVLTVSPIIAPGINAASNKERYETSIRKSARLVKVDFVSHMPTERIRSTMANLLYGDDMPPEQDSLAPGLANQTDGVEETTQSLKLVPSYQSLRFWNRRWFVVGEVGSDARLGLGHGNMEVGDVLVVLFGFSRILILRPCESWYTIVGSCLVPGLMQGEVVHRNEKAGIPPTMFEVR